MADTAMTRDVTIVPASEASCEDLQAVLGRSYPSRCQCQRHKMRGREWDLDSVPVGERARRLREQTCCGQPAARTTSGLVAYLEGEPVGWCGVAASSPPPGSPRSVTRPSAGS
jgi:hypothetical protein